MLVNAIHCKKGVARVNAAHIGGDPGPRISAKIGPKWLRIIRKDSWYDLLCTAKLQKYSIPHTGNKLC